jgi:DNA-directed RNA polymerase specialized sigma subunit
MNAPNGSRTAKQSRSTIPTAKASDGRRKSPINSNRNSNNGSNSRQASPYANNKRYEMLEHDILTAEEEQSLGNKVRRAIKIKKKMERLVEQKHEQQMEHSLKEESYLRNMSADLLLGTTGSTTDFDDDGGEDLEGLSVYGLGQNTMLEYDKKSLASAGSVYSSPEGDMDTLTLWNNNDDVDFEDSMLPLDTNLQPSNDSDDVRLTEEDIVETLGIAGGRAELTRVLIDGALARDKLISSNIRLVVSICKKWCHQSTSNSADPNDHRLATLYAGSWTRPSLDEAIQEGIVGLATAADRFEPERKLKFGTYATYWITSFVRKCFQQAATGCLRVPPHYHVYKQQYQRIVKKHYDANGSSPSVDTVAKELGLTRQRLEFILKSTQALVSIDAPGSRGSMPGQGGKAGADASSSENNLLLSNTLSW